MIGQHEWFEMFRDVCLFVCLFVCLHLLQLAASTWEWNILAVPASQFRSLKTYRLTVVSTFHCCVHISSLCIFLFTSWKSATGRFPTGNGVQGGGGKKRPGGHFSGGALDLWSPLDAVARCQRCSKPSHTAAWGAADSFVMAWFLYRLVNAVRQTGHS